MGWLLLFDVQPHTVISSEIAESTEWINTKIGKLKIANTHSLLPELFIPSPVVEENFIYNKSVDFNCRSEESVHQQTISDVVILSEWFSLKNILVLQQGAAVLGSKSACGTRRRKPI